MVVRVMNRWSRSGRSGSAAVAATAAATVAVAVLVAAMLIATGASSGAAGTSPGVGGVRGAVGAGRGGAVTPFALAPVGHVSQGASYRAGVDADVSYHGHVSLWDGRLGVWLTTANHGPAPVTGATLRLRFSVPLAPGADLPANCLRTGAATVHCGTGSMRAAGSGVRIALDVAVVGTPSEVALDIDTVWNGGANDRNTANNTHRVLALATGDAYTF
ncbi:hypothetical protein ABZ726_07215 [Streptomyces hundungensis]|uniref:hypothetical protein n=1 Tax=Streptomyces hundungensis TaxID=1077946 RepID=UPI0033CE7E36